MDGLGFPEIVDGLEFPESVDGFELAEFKDGFGSKECLACLWYEEFKVGLEFGWY